MNLRGLQWWLTETQTVKVSYSTCHHWYSINIRFCVFFHFLGVSQQNIYPLGISRHSRQQWSMTKLDDNSRLLPLIILAVTVKTLTSKILCWIIFFDLICVHSPALLTLHPLLPLWESQHPKAHFPLCPFFHKVQLLKKVGDTTQ